MFDSLIKNLKAFDKEVACQEAVIKRCEAKILKAKKLIEQSKQRRQVVLIDAYGQVPTEVWHRIDISVYKLFKLYHGADLRLAKVKHHDFHITSASLVGEMLKFDIRIDGDPARYTLTEHNSVFDSFDLYFKIRKAHIRRILQLDTSKQKIGLLNE